MNISTLTADGKAFQTKKIFYDCCLCFVSLNTMNDQVENHIAQFTYYKRVMTVLPLNQEQNAF